MADEPADVASDNEDTQWTPIDNFKGTDLEWSTAIVVDVLDADGKIKNKNRCLFCSSKFTGGPFNIRTHCDIAVKPRSIRECKPKPPFKARHLAVLTALRARAASANSKAARIKAKADARASAAAATDPAIQFYKMTTAEAVAKAWMKVIVKKALPLDLVTTASSARRSR
jgi:hypothetical protein